MVGMSVEITSMGMAALLVEEGAQLYNSYCFSVD
jgi:hypothetical protein